MGGIHEDRLLAMSSPFEIGHPMALSNLFGPLKQLEMALQ